MADNESTCWTMIDAAARGSESDGAEFARRYGPIVRAYLASRWRGSRYLDDLDDAAQEVFLECFRQNGALDRADRHRDFRPFLYGVVRHVALRLESRRLRLEGRALGLSDAPEPVDSGADQSREFDRAWARSLMREAARLQELRAESTGDGARRRVELLRLRFHDGLPIRAIAERWNSDAAQLHHEFARARQEFRTALYEIMAFHHPGSSAEIELECASLLALLA